MRVISRMPPERTELGCTTSTRPFSMISSNSNRVEKPQSPTAMRVSTVSASRARPARLSAGKGASMKNGLNSAIARIESSACPTSDQRFCTSINQIAVFTYRLARRPHDFHIPLYADMGEAARPLFQFHRPQAAFPGQCETFANLAHVLARRVDGGVRPHLLLYLARFRHGAAWPARSVRRPACPAPCPAMSHSAVSTAPIAAIVTPAPAKQPGGGIHLLPQTLDLQRILPAQ